MISPTTKSKLNLLKNTDSLKRLLIYSYDIENLEPVLNYLLEQILLVEKDNILQIGNGKIGVDDISALIHLSAQKNSNNSTIVIINGFESFTLEAQNKLLKVIEDYGDKFNIVLLANSSRKLLPTIESRTTILRDAKLTRRDYDIIFKELKLSEVDKSKLEFMSAGSLASLRGILKRDESKIKAGQLAKMLVGGDKLELYKHLGVDLKVLLGALNTAKYILDHKINQSSDLKILKKINSLKKLLIETEEDLIAGYNQKIVFSKYIIFR